MPCNHPHTTDIAPENLFTCTNCGDCCRGYGGTYVSPQDIETIAAFLGMDAGHFENTCCQSSGRRLVLAQADNGYCVFWNQGCTIHAVKPRMCRAWPFIAAVLADPQNWEIMAGVCPGMKPGVESALIQKAVRQVLATR